MRQSGGQSQLSTEKRIVPSIAGLTIPRQQTPLARTHDDLIRI